MPTVSVTFTPNSPQQQINCNPDSVAVPYGNNQVVTWNLYGPQGSTFASNGINFKSASPGTLVRVSDTQYQLTDDNTNTTGTEIDYPYTVNLMYNNQPYTYDPQVANEPGGGGGGLKYKSA